MSSLGVLTSFGKYDNFEVLENIQACCMSASLQAVKGRKPLEALNLSTGRLAPWHHCEAAHAALMGVNLSVCTSGASGTMAMSVQVTKSLNSKSGPFSWRTPIITPPPPKKNSKKKKPKTSAAKECGAKSQGVGPGTMPAHQGLQNTNF